MQNLAASYGKEIEMLRKKLDEANKMLEKNNLQKVNMQENLKKAFMRGVCALNFEAMNILDPNGEDPKLAEKSTQHLNQIEHEMIRQFDSMSQGQESPMKTQMRRDMSGNELLPSSNLVTPSSHAGMSLASSRINNTGPSYGIHSVQKNNITQTAPHIRNLSDSRYSAMMTDGGLTYSASAVSEVSESNEETLRPTDDFINVQDVRIESKDHMWRPAPIVGRDFATRPQEPELNFNASVTTSLRGPAMNNFMT